MRITPKASCYYNYFKLNNATLAGSAHGIKFVPMAGKTRGDIRASFCLFSAFPVK